MNILFIVVVILLTGCGATEKYDASVNKPNSQLAVNEYQQMEAQTQSSAKRSEQHIKQPWVTHATGKLLKSTKHYKIHAYYQPGRYIPGSKNQEDLTGCGHNYAKYSVVHEKDFERRFTRSYLDEIVNSFDFWQEGKLRCGDIKQIWVHIYIDGLFRNHSGYTESVDSIGSHTDFPFVAVNLYYDATLHRFRFGKPQFTAFPIHPIDIEEELESVNSTIAYRARGRSKTAQSKIDRADSVCAERIGPRMTEYYKENLRSRGFSRIPELLHCGQFDRLSGSNSDYEMGRIFTAFVRASDQVCGSNTPNGSTSFSITRARQECKQDRLGNKFDCRDLPSTDKVVHVDRELASKFNYYWHGGQKNMGEALRDFLNDPLFSEREQLFHNFSLLLQTVGCAGNVHRLIQTNLLRFTNGQTSLQTSQ